MHGMGEAVRDAVGPSNMRSAVRFAIAIVLTDLIVLRVFSSGAAVVMGSFAAIVLLYFLDYDGSTRERLVGYSTATGVGLLAILLGTLIAQPLWLAIAGSLVVSAIFGFARVLRGYVARAAVGLQGAFYVPVMAAADLGELPPLLASWLVGALVALACALWVMPRDRAGTVRVHLRTWLQAAADFADDVAAGRDLIGTRARLHLATESLISAVHGPSMRPGAVGRRQRALAEMVDFARWSPPLFDAMRPLPPGSDVALVRGSADALSCAAAIIGGSPLPSTLPDLSAERAADLTRLGAASVDDLRSHYPARLLSIMAMWMLWLAGGYRGLRLPPPDVGSMADERPLALLIANARPNSLWFRNALRTGACSAACVLIVRELGIEHGLWVVLAALSVTQVSFSGVANSASSLRTVGGAAAGVAVASLGIFLHLPQLAYLILLPFAAMAAVTAARVGPFTAQLFFTPFALINLAALQWETTRGLQVVRLVDIAIGVGVAAVFAFAIFPFGLRGQLRRQADAALASSADYLVAAASSARGAADGVPPSHRPAVVSALVALEATMDAAFIRDDVSNGTLASITDKDSLARDRLIGGDACRDLAQQRAADPSLASAAEAFSGWWLENLLTDPRADGAVTAQRGPEGARRPRRAHG